MAKSRSNISAGTPMSNNTFDKGANTDVRDYHLDKRSWTHARNAINNSHIGDLGNIGNEPANKFCASAPFEIIGTIHLEKTYWIVLNQIQMFVND